MSDATFCVHCGADLPTDRREAGCPTCGARPASSSPGDREGAPQAPRVSGRRKQMGLVLGAYAAVMLGLGLLTVDWHASSLPGARNKRGLELMGQRKFDEAIVEFREAIHAQPDLAPAHCNLGLALYQKGELDEAAAEARAAIRIEPGFAEPHNNLGFVLMTRGRLDEAIARFRTAIWIKPVFAEAHANLGTALSCQGLPDRAIEELRKALRCDPRLAEAHVRLGLLLESLGHFQEALDELRLGHGLGSKQPGWPYPSAEWAIQAERFAELEKRWPAVARGDDKPGNAEEALAFADFAYLTKRYSAAVGLLEDALRADPDLADGLEMSERYNVVCGAVLAGAGKSVDAAETPLDDAARAHCREKAREWLSAILKQLAERVENDGPDAIEEARQMLQHCQSDPDLSTVRGPEALEALPGPEQTAWRALWAEVDRLLKQTERSNAGPTPPQPAHPSTKAARRQSAPRPGLAPARGVKLTTGSAPGL